MGPEIRNFAETAQFVKNHPEEADYLRNRWRAFVNTYARENPEILSINSKEEFLRWTAQHPEKHIDTNIWIGKEITDFYLRRQQEGPRTQAQEGDDKKGERHRDEAREMPREPIKNIIERGERVSQPTTPTSTYQPRIQTPTRGFFDRGGGRGISGIGTRFGPPGRRVVGFGRLGARLVTQTGMAAGRAAVAVGAGLVSNPIGWIVIGVIIAIMIIVFLIIMFAGGGGVGGGKPVSTIECLDADGNVITVTDGNTCAENYAAYYTKQEGIAVTAKCLDKCTDFVANSCGRNVSNTCDFPLSSCGAPLLAFCIEYTPANVALGRQHDCLTGGHGYVGTPLGVNSCGGTIALTPTPTPTPTP